MPATLFRLSVAVLACALSAAPAAAQVGNMGRNVLTGPGMVNQNLALFRTISLTEKLKMEFKAEAFNFTNTPHFGNPSANVSDMALNPDGTIRSLGNFMSITSANVIGGGGQEPGDERQLRFGLRFSF